MWSDVPDMFLPVAALVGIFAGWGLSWVYNRLPESWLQEYGFQREDPDWIPARRLRRPTGRLALAALTGAGFAVIVSAVGWNLAALLTVLVFCVLILAAVPDALNRIIPDQAVMLLALLGAAFTALDLASGAGVRDVVVDRLGGAVAAGGLLLLIGVVASALLKRDAMGMGDVKLLFVCGLLTGLRLVPLLYFITFIAAAVVMLPITARQRREEEEDEGVETAEDTDHSEEARQIPLGPFICAACFLCLVAGEWLSSLLFPYLALL